MIEAAGGAVGRETRKRRVEVLLVHRPRQNDWSFPKGKLKSGESPVDGALREVLEETGLHCNVGDELPAVHYADRRGRPKRVRYWTMRAYDGEFRPNDEVDRVRWVRLDRVGETRSYERDLVVVSALTVIRAAVA